MSDCSLVSSLSNWAEIAGWSLVTFAFCVVVGRMAKYRLQLIYSASHEGSQTWVPRARTRPEFRHLVLFLLAGCTQYIHREQHFVRPAAVILWAVLLAAWGALLLRDSVSDLKGGGAQD